jgi:mRNA interferase MazF
MTLFDVVLLPFPFTDSSTTKQRPCLVLAAFHRSGFADLALVAMITSQMNGYTLPGDTQLTKWKEASLLKPSLVRLAKIVTIERSLVRKRLGRLATADQKAIRKQFRVLFADLV